jgi:hypothetical protein
MTYHELLTLLEPPQERCQSTDVHGVRQNRHEMVQDAGDFGKQGPDVFCANRNVNIQQLLDGQRKALLVGHHGDVVEAVEIRQRLEVGPVLDQLLGSAMQQANVRVGAHNLLAIELQDQSQHAVGGRVLRPKVHRVVSDFPLVRAVILAGGNAVGC